MTSQGRNGPKIFMQPLLKISLMKGEIPMGTPDLVIARPRNLELGLCKSNFSGWTELQMIVMTLPNGFGSHSEQTHQASDLGYAKKK